MYVRMYVCVPPQMYIIQLHIVQCMTVIISHPRIKSNDIVYSNSMYVNI